MRIAVLADIHAHLPALTAVLAEIDSSGVDAIVLNGDMVTGPMPGPTLETLAALGDRAVWVRGNCEREVVEAWDGGGLDHLPAVARETTGFAAAQLSRAHRDLIADLPLSVVLDIDGLGLVRFCHASTRNDTEIVLVDSPVERYQACFPDLVEETVVLGHTHMPFDRLVDRRRYVNPGSVGMPYGRMGAHWALLGPEVVLKRTPYDASAAAGMMRAQAPDYPGLADFVDENVCAVPSDAEALAIFWPGSVA